MLVKEKIVKEEDEVGYYDAIFDSSNILQTTYFPQQERLYISFNRGGVYSYQNITKEKYEEFKNAESQGKYFIKEIKNKSDEHPYRKEFSLYPEEIKNLKEERDNKKKEIEEENIENNNTTELKNDESDSTVYFDKGLDTNNIIFNIDYEEYIKISSEGFFWKGKLIKEDNEIYEKFKQWLNWTYNNIELFNWVNSELNTLTNKNDLTEFEKGQLHELKTIKQWI